MNDGSTTMQEIRRLQMQSLASQIRKCLVFSIVVIGIVVALRALSARVDFVVASNTPVPAKNNSLLAAAPRTDASSDLASSSEGVSTNAPSVSKPSRKSKATVDAIKIQLTKSGGTQRTYSGVLKPAQSSNLGFQRTGRVVDVRVDLGDKVNKDDVLAILDMRSLEADKSVLQAELVAAKSRLDELSAGPRQQTIDSAKAKLAEYQSMIQLWEINANRSERLLESSAGSRKSFDDARLQYAASKSRYESQRQVVAELEAGTRKEQIQAQKAIVDKLQASIDGINIKLDESVLKAPFNGIVSKRYIDLGATVAPGTNVLLLVDTDQPEAWIGLPTQVTSSINAGGDYPIQMGDQVIKTTLRTVLPELDPVTRTQTAIFEFPQFKNDLQFGRIVRFEHRQQQGGAEGFWVPKSSLTHGVRGLWSVFALVPNNPTNSQSETDGQPETYLLQRRDVEVLQIESDRVLVRGTIELGQLIVAGGVQKLVGGQTVSVREVLAQTD